MRKILLGTTAVVGAALLAPAAFAQTGVTTAPGATPLSGAAVVGTQGVTAPTPAIAAASGLTVRLGGFFDFSMAGIQDDWDRARSRNDAQGLTGAAANRQARQRYDFRNDLELNVFIDGRAANGMTYGAVFEFQMDNTATGAADGTTVSMDEAYLYLSFPNLGTLRFGQEDSAASLLQVRAPSAGLVASDGDWYDFIVGTGLYSNYVLSGINDGSDATKITYLSPQFAGFDFGVSYAANGGEGERENLPASASAQRDRTGLENELSAAIRYRGTFGPVGVNAGFGTQYADAPRLASTGAVLNPRPQQVNAYTVGLTVSAYGFALGGEYTWGAYNGSSVARSALNAGLDDSQHFIIGATYTMGPLLIGGNFGQGKQSNGSQRVAGVIRDLDDRTHTAWGIGAVYTLAPGLATYVIYQNINDENIPTSAPSDARYGGSGTTLASFNGSNTRTINVLMGGIRLAF
ncbi:porin [Roseomonas eburnea]|uniref:Porin n=1 Tax=Neoroseomonas eburnea TaxID=1346889 RepID=A0A9X9XDK1_9PROT|nr:porin [Neoroseomonas eburnea]MBR0681787.1 porin [Neoroseomonas eburnea]